MRSATTPPTPETDAVRILIVEDHAFDAELMLAEVRRVGIRHAATRVQTREAFEAALAELEPDLILCDYNLPRFSAPEVLEIVGKQETPVPVIVVSGAIDEKTAIRLLDAGAMDYVLKSNWLRLGPSVARALTQARERRERLADQERLVAGEARFRAFASSAHDGAIIADEAGRIQFWNQAATWMFGYPATEAMGQPLTLLIPGRFHASYEAGIEQTMATARESTGATGFCTEVTGLRKDGAEFPVEASVSTWLEDGAVFASVMLRDISQKREYSAQLMRSQERFKTLVEQLPAITYISSPGKVGGMSWISPQVEDSLGIAPEELVANPGLFVERIHPEDRPHVHEMSVRARETGQPVEVEFRVRHSDGTYRWLRDRMLLLRDAEGGSVQIQGVLLDTTDVKRVEQQKALLGMTIDQSADMVVITDMEGRIQYVNRAFEEVTGYSADEVLGKNPSVLKSDKQDPDFYQQMWTELTHGRTWTAEFTNRRKDGTLYQQDSRVFPVVDRSGTVVNYVGIARDTTKEKALETQLMQAQRMEAVGLLSGGIAHDFNNLLTVIIANASLIAGDLASDQKQIASDIRTILTAANQGADLVHKLMGFARHERLSLEVVDLTELLDDIGDVLRRVIAEDIDIRTEYGHGAARCRVDRGVVQQILLNLATNARDAMPAGGTLRITTGHVTCAGPVGLPAWERTDCEYVRISVGDSGSGMDDETAARIFEPFFTTKERDKGTGLGLSMVHGLMAQHDGFIDVESELGVGTTMSIHFPIVVADKPIARVRPVNESNGRPAAGGEVVLIVEDEPSLRSGARRVLERVGYRVLTAADGAQALSILERADPTVDLVVSDVVMPTMGGPELYSSTLTLEHRPRFLFTSGYSISEREADEEIIRSLPFLHKPWTLDELTGAVREALSERPVRHGEVSG